MIPAHAEVAKSIRNAVVDHDVCKYMKFYLQIIRVITLW